MALQSFMTPLGTPLPPTTLPNLNGESVNLEELRGNGPLVVVFACNHCPYVRHVEATLGKVAAASAQNGVAWAAISSNDASRHPEDDVPGLKEQSVRAAWDFPYLVDADQSAARAFGAACTPDFFLFDDAGRLAYRGALDTSTPGNGEPLTGELLREAIGLVRSGQPVPEPHRPSMGCSIKWLPGNDPTA